MASESVDHRKAYFLQIQLIFSLLLATSTCLVAQQSAENNLPGLEIKENQSSKITIRYHSEDVISNLLVLVTDPDGNTTFLENKYKFTGNYSQLVDLSGSKKGEYFFTIICDEKKVIRKIQIK
ncbi:MAG: hypothetical protein H0W61_15370 [Bacteroidetes bacterium]|nr:hypothetical protein [Bacteroidota bacterium]